ncbi:MAG: oxidoreductase [Anaerolineae bacterium]
MSLPAYRRIASLKDVHEFRSYVATLRLDLPCDDTILTGHASPLWRPLRVYGRSVGNRWTAQPMEGWDATAMGGITEPLLRRWRRIGASGAKIVWGEAMAMRPDGRANPHQLVISLENRRDLEQLCNAVLGAHRERYGTTADLLLGFQLTHSGRFSRPFGRPEPRVAFRHPLLDSRFGVHSDAQVLTDAEIEDLVAAYAHAASLAREVGADFVDIKCCHGYLLHEFLSARTRSGPYGGPFENRSRLLREIVMAIRRDAPGLLLAVRLSAFDTVPYQPDPSRSQPGHLGPGVPVDYGHLLPYVFAFGANADSPTQPDLQEPVRLLQMLSTLGIELVNVTAGSPYYTPHLLRPALFPPSDGYGPPEDPLAGVARHVHLVRALKEQCPQMILVGSGYTYLQEYLPHVAQSTLRQGWVDSVGIGRALLSYPEMLADATMHGTLDRLRICRTFSDCTTAPRQGLPSGCYPLDKYYRLSPHAAHLRQFKSERGQ